LEPYEKVLVDDEFIEEDPHGEIACEQCHGGNPKATTFEEAHKGIVKDPSWPDPSKACGECHEEAVEISKGAPHVTLASFNKIIGARASTDPAIRKKLFDEGMKTHCSQCHSSCGQCHVSRPDAVEGGFVEGHLFQKTPPMETNCTSCHGSRVEKEYLGKNKGFPADVHWAKKGMTCVACHKGEEMHGTGKAYGYRYEVENMPTCEGCHKEALKKGKAHRIHKNKVSCQVCHSVAYKNCYNCHVGKDAQGIPYFKTEKSEMNFKIGLNPLRSKRRPYKFVTVRHIPVTPGTFDFYVKGGLSNFSALPTWKLATPHNIQRKTPQNSSCNSCHGKRELFLLEKDVPPQEQEANKGVIVPEKRVPKPKGKR